jgi:hypothetical protein
MAGFVTALLSGQVTNSLPTRAQMVANKVPAAITTIATSGYFAAGDGGAATYVRGPGPYNDGSSFADASGAWWKLSVSTVVLSMFGAVGGLAGQGSYGSLPDDTTPIQNALNYCIANGCKLQIPPRHFRFTKSLNAGKTSPFNGLSFRIQGDTSGQSRLIADLTEAYPAIDLTNQGHARIEHIGFDTTTTSLHTCGWLVAETTGTGCNNGRFDNCYFIDQGTSSKYCVFGLTADQWTLDNSLFVTYAGGLAAVRFTRINPDAIASKFYAIGANDADHTVFSATNSAFIATNGPGLWLQAYNGVSLPGCYCGVIGTVGHAQGLLRLGTTGGAWVQSVFATNFRTEDQVNPTATIMSCTASIAPNADLVTSTMTVSATATGAVAVGQLLIGTGLAFSTVVLANVSANVWIVSNSQTVASETITAQQISSPAVYVEDYLPQSTFHGSFNTSGAGAFGGPGQYIDCNVQAEIGTGAFNYAGPIIGGKYTFSGATSYGNFGAGYGGSFDQVNSRNYALGGAIGLLATALAAYGGTCAEFTDLTSEYPPDHPTRWIAYQTRVFSPQANTPINYRIGIQGEAGTLTPTAYTGGGGLAQVAQAVISPAFFYYNPGGGPTGLVRPMREFIIEGLLGATWAASGQIELTLSQAVTGSPSAVLASLTGIGAYAAGAGFIATVRAYFDGYQWYANTKLQLFGPNGASTMNVTSLGTGTSSFLFASSVPLDFNVLINNTGSSPLANPITYVLR